MALSESAVRALRQAFCVRPPVEAEIIAALNNVGTTATVLSATARQAFRNVCADRRAGDAFVAAVAVTAGATVNRRFRDALIRGLGDRPRGVEVVTRINNDVAY